MVISVVGPIIRAALGPATELEVGIGRSSFAAYPVAAIWVGGREVGRVVGKRSA